MVSLVLALVAGGVLVFQETLLGNQYAQTSSGGTLQGQVPIASTPMTLNSIAYAERAVQANLTLPNATILGPGFKIIGVQIQERPTNDTLSNGVTYKYWSVNLYISSKAFVNGSTLNTDVIPNAVLVTETPAAPGTNSYDTAQSFLQPGQACVVSNYNTTAASSTCSDMEGPSRQSVQIGDTYLVVTPSVPNAYFMINQSGPVVAIYPAAPAVTSGETSSVVSYQQVLALAGSMIQSQSISTP